MQLTAAVPRRSYRGRNMRHPHPEDRIVSGVIGLLGLAVFAACVWVLWQSGCQFNRALSVSEKAMGIAGLIVASGIIFAGMSLVLRLRSSREDHPPSLSAPVLIICLGGAMALGALYIDSQHPALDEQASHRSALVNTVNTAR
jgi:divalent metal cation (Fe/Co/Zn/Cd) transporter